MEIFPESVNTALTMELIISKLTYFHETLHLIHWQTMSYAEHQAVGGLYEYVHDFKDGVVEKLIGYTGKRPGNYKIEPINGTISSSVVVSDLINFASKLKAFGETNNYHDIANLADSLSGEAAKVRFLLSLR